MREARAEMEELNMINIEPNEAPVATTSGVGGASEGAPSRNGARRKTVSLQAKKPTKATASRATKAKKALERVPSPRTGTKGAKVLEMLARGKAATLAQIMKVTGWQAHSVRGFLSIAAKKHRIKIHSTRNEAGDRIYRIIK
jgi:hypothetical protein